MLLLSAGASLLLWSGASPALAARAPGGPVLPAAASGDAGTPPDETLLDLGATAVVSAVPDELVAEFASVATASDPAAAQRAVNAASEAALAAARGVAGVAAIAGNYTVDRAGPHDARWRAQQSLVLRGTDGAALLSLARRLQARGLLLRSLSWRLSDAARRAATDDTTVAALHRLRADAARDAEALGLRVERLRTVRIDAAPFAPRPLPMMMMGAMAASASASEPAPVATAASEPVSSSVSATVVLGP